MSVPPTISEHLYHMLNHLLENARSSLGLMSSKGSNTVRSRIGGCTGFVIEVIYSNESFHEHKGARTVLNVHHISNCIVSELKSLEIRPIFQGMRFRLKVDGSNRATVVTPFAYERDVTWPLALYWILVT
jgi:hypothetical protein